MLTINEIIILRNTDLKRFFDISEFWNKRKTFFETVANRTPEVFFDTEKEKICYSFFKMWNEQEGNIQAEIRDERLCASVGSEDKYFSLGRLCDYYQQVASTMTSKKLMGLTLLYLMLGADDKNSEIDINYDFLSSISKSVDVIPKEDFVVKRDNWTIPRSEQVSPLSRKVIANKSDNPITISSGDKNETLQPGECVVGLFTSTGCYKLLPHHLISQDGGLQMRLVCGVNCANLEIHKPDNRVVVNGVCSFFIERGNKPIYLKDDGTFVSDQSCFGFNRDLGAFKRNHGDYPILAFDKVDDFYKFY